MDDLIATIQCDEFEDDAPDRDEVLREINRGRQVIDDYYDDLIEHEQQMGWDD